MRRTIITLAIIIFTVSTAWAGPFLVCDPYPADSQPTHYAMRVDGVAVQTPYGAVASDGGSVVLDLQGYSSGPHAVTDIVACNARGCSEPPLAYGVPGLPASPSLRLVP